VSIGDVDAIDVERDDHLTKSVTLCVRGAAVATRTARGPRRWGLSWPASVVLVHIRAGV
jgi:hypothetical protein